METNTDLDKIITNICSYYKVAPTDLAKKKRGQLPEFTYHEVVHRLLLVDKPLTDIFPELCKSSITRLLKRAFPDKPSSNHKWCHYLLGLIKMHKCLKCEKIQDLENFYYDKCSNDYRCKQCELLRVGDYYQRNKASISIQKAKFYKNNRAKLLEYQKEYRETHKAEFKAKDLRRFIRLKRATPPWADFSAMNIIYSERKEGEHTDHIVPLRGILVSGLHNEFNLRNIPAQENLSKGNKFDPETYVHELP